MKNMQCQSCVDRDRRVEKTGKKEVEVENIFKIYCLKSSKINLKIII